MAPEQLEPHLELLRAAPTGTSSRRVWAGHFCPLIRRTKKLTELVDLRLAEKARETVRRAGGRLAARAASFCS